MRSRLVRRPAGGPAPRRAQPPRARTVSRDVSAARACEQHRGDLLGVVPRRDVPAAVEPQVRGAAACAARARRPWRGMSSRSRAPQAIVTGTSRSPGATVASSGSVALEARRRREVAGRQHGVGGRHAPRPGEELALQQRAPGARREQRRRSRARALGRARASRRASGARTRSRARARSRAATARSRSAPGPRRASSSATRAARASCRRRAGARCRAASTSSATASASAPSVTSPASGADAPKPGRSSGDDVALARPSGRAPGVQTCHWLPIPWMSTSGSPDPWRTWLSTRRKVVAPRRPARAGWRRTRAPTGRLRRDEAPAAACPAARARRRAARLPARARGRRQSRPRSSRPTSPPEGQEPAKAVGKPAVVKRGLETILQDDGLFLFRPVAEIEAAVAQGQGARHRHDPRHRGLVLADARRRPAGQARRLRRPRPRLLRAVALARRWTPRSARSAAAACARSSTSASGRRAGRRPTPARAPARTSTRRPTPTTPPPSRCATPARSPRRPTRRTRPPPPPDARPVAHPVDPAAVRAVPDPRPARGDPAAGDAADADAPAAAQRAPRRLGRRRQRRRPTRSSRRSTSSSSGTSPTTRACCCRSGRPTRRRRPARASTARCCAPATRPSRPCARRPKVLVGNTSSTGGTRGAGPVPPLEFLRDARLRRPQAQAARRRPTARTSRSLPGDGWAHHPYSQNERPSRVSQARDPSSTTCAWPTCPQLATTLDVLVKMGRLAPANRNIYLTEFGYETQPVARPADDRRAPAGALADLGRVPRREGPDGEARSRSSSCATSRPRRSASPRARRGRSASTRPACSSPTARTRSPPRRSSPASSRRSAPRAACCSSAACGWAPVKQTVTIQRLVPKGTWEKIDTLKIDGRSSFTRTIAHVPGSQYRLGYPGPRGPRSNSIAIKPVPADPKR